MPKITQLNIWPFLVLIGGVLTSIYLATAAASGNYVVLTLIFGGILAAALVGVVHKNLLAIGLLIATVDLWMAPLGFKTSAMEQSGLVAFVLWLLVCWRKKFNPNFPKAFETLNTWSFFRTATIVTFSYAFIHFLFNMFIPYDELAFGVKGATKTYLQVFGPFMMIVAIMKARLLLPVDAKGSRRLITVFALAYLAIFTVQLVHVVRHGMTPAGELMTMAEKQEANMSFMIPILNIWDSQYTLRTAGPAATLIGATFLFCGKGQNKILLTILIMVGFVGSAISGGRGAIVFSLLMVCAAALFARKVAGLLSGAMILVLAATIILLLPSSMLVGLPWHVQRSVGMIRGDLQTNATDSIESSTDMRTRYFKYAWEYWVNGDARLMVLGRSVSQMDEQDVQSFALWDEERMMFFAVRRLATHNGVTDMLVGFGAIGYGLSLVVWIACLLMLKQLNKLYIKGSSGHCWSFIAFVYMSYWLIYTHVGGSFVWALAIWLVLVALAQVDGLIVHAEAPAKSARTTPMTLRPAFAHGTSESNKGHSS